jgi:transposase
MNKNMQFFIGIDVSKPWFDVSLLALRDGVKEPITSERFDNTSEGISVFRKWLQSNKVSFNEDALVVIENTGIYHRLIWSFCSKHSLPLHIGNATHVKRCFGIARGKTDKIDSKRLCLYAFKEADTLKACPTLDPVLLQLKDLSTSRTRLLSQLGSNKTYLKELRNISDKNVQKILEQAYKKAIGGVEASIKAIEGEMVKLIGANKDIKANYDLLVSVPGIGHITAIYLICCTANFSSKISGKQLACYAGVVPFEHTSGISIKAKKRVHPMANKDLKRLLHLGALSAVQYHLEFTQYYKRKKEEGKNSMSILNAIRNKIVLRAVAVVSKQQPYVNKWQQAA